MRSRFGHWSPRYILDRLKVALFQFRQPDAPWLTSDAVRFLDDWLTSGDEGLEFGSGRSTLWFADRVSSLTSVEHDRKWYGTIANKIEQKGVTNIHYLYRPVGEAHQGEIGESYAAVALKFQDHAIDFVLVDGADRSACALASIEIVKPGGILIIDNVNWALPSASRSPASRSLEQGHASEEWREFSRKVATWRRVWTSNGVTDTAIYFKDFRP